MKKYYSQVLAIGILLVVLSSCEVVKPNESIQSVDSRVENGIYTNNNYQINIPLGSEFTYKLDTVLLGEKILLWATTQTGAWLTLHSKNHMGGSDYEELQTLLPSRIQAQYPGANLQGTRMVDRIGTKVLFVDFTTTIQRDTVRFQQIIAIRKNLITNGLDDVVLTVSDKNKTFTSQSGLQKAIENIVFN